MTDTEGWIVIWDKITYVGSDKTSWLQVPGGRLYRTVVNTGKEIGVSMVFVPDVIANQSIFIEKDID